MTSYTQTNSPDMLLKMAQAATRNSGLLAHLIEERCQQKNITWAQLAAELQISEAQLAKLALCRQPGSRRFKADVAEAARYANIDPQKLIKFLQPASEQKVSKKPFWQTSLSWPNRIGDQPMIVKRAIAFGVVLIAIFLISAVVFSQPASTEATLQVTIGEVVVQQTTLLGQTTTVVVSGGETLTVSGSDTIEVLSDAAAVLYLFEGSTVELSANTQLELTEFADNGSDQQIYMTLLNGRILNRVTKLLGVDDAYQVRTPSSTASVRGTIFSVEVLDQLSSQIVVTEGIVAVSLGNEMAEVQAGEMVTAVTGQPLNVQPINNPELLAPAAPPQIPTNITSGQSSEEPRITAGEATAMPSDTANSPTTTTESPAGTTASPGSPTNTVPASQPPGSSATSAPSLPTSPSGATQPPNTSATSLPPTNTRVSPVVPTNTSVPGVPTNTPVPPTVPTNTPAPPVVPTNTPVPPVVPTNTPVPVVPTNTPVPPPVPTDTPQPSRVTVCHSPGPNQQTKEVNADALQSHLNHGDYLGPCN